MNSKEQVKEQIIDYDKDLRSAEIKNRIVYGGGYTNEIDLRFSASGGAATALSKAILAIGGVVFGVGYACDFRSAKYYCAKCENDLSILRGSKYITSNKTVTVNGEEISVFVLVAEYLSNGFNVLFIGLGCDVGAILAYCNNKNISTEKLYTIDLICHGPTFPSVQEQYVEALEKRYKSKIIDFSVRYKKRMVKPPYIRAVFNNGRVFTRPFYETDFGFAFDNYSRMSCFECKYKGDAHQSDITIGDYWGVGENTDEDIFNPLGV